MRVTFNLVPSLLVQLEAFAEDRARDRYLELGLKPADATAPTTTCVHPRELLPRATAADDRRLSALRRTAGAARRRADRAGLEARRRFTDDDLRDLQVWHKLAWIDPLYLDARSARARRWSRRAAASPRRTSAMLRDVELEILRRGHSRVPRGGGARTGRDFDLAVLSPDSAAAVRHRHLPADAPALARCRGAVRASRRCRRTAERAAACHERLFGAPPIGLWPSEGSVSDAMVPLVAQAGFSGWRQTR